MPISDISAAISRNHFLSVWWSVLYSIGMLVMGWICNVIHSGRAPLVQYVWCNGLPEACSMTCISALLPLNPTAGITIYSIILRPVWSPPLPITVSLLHPHLSHCQRQHRIFMRASTFLFLMYKIIPITSFAFHCKSGIFTCMYLQCAFSAVLQINITYMNRKCPGLWSNVWVPCNYPIFHLKKNVIFTNEFPIKGYVHFFKLFYIVQYVSAQCVIMVGSGLHFGSS